jgi:hypothetical protein
VTPGYTTRRDTYLFLSFYPVFAPEVEFSAAFINNVTGNSSPAIIGCAMEDIGACRLVYNVDDEYRCVIGSQ